MTGYTGKVINNRFKVCELLGEGGMSFVFKALDIQKDNYVVVKFMKEKVTSNYIDDIIRFKREIEVVSNFDHGNIIKMIGAGELESIPYLIMELLEGESLSDLIYKGKKFNEGSTVSMIIQLAEALNYVHGKGVIHGDLKPGNIFLIDGEGKNTVKLLDFGVAHLMELGEISGEREITGTFGYMSPETTGILNRRIDERSDLYSLGVIMYQLLTDEIPFKEKGINRILHQQVAFTPPRPSKINPNIPKILEEITMKLLAKDPDLRYQSAKGLLHDVKRYTMGERDFVIGEKDQKVKLTFQTSLIGRDKEYEKIKGLFNMAKAGKGSLCLIAGEAGVGKSRLVEEIRGYVYEQDGVLIRGRCLNHENKNPYQPFKDAIDEYIRHFEKLDTSTRGRDISRIKEIVGDLSEIVLRLNPRLEKILGESKKLNSLEAERENQRFLMVLSEFFCNLAANEKVCVLYLDDLQWIDEGSINLLKEIFHKISNSNLLILGTYRDNEISHGHSLERLKETAQSSGSPIFEIKLHPFNHQKLNQLVAHLLNEKEDKSEKLTRYLLETSNGNPFFTINIIKELVENNALIWKDGFWEEDSDKISLINVSGNVIDIILKRIMGLNSKQNDILCKGAIIGREFEIELLYNLVNLSKDEIVSILDNLISMQLLEKSQERGKLLFVHDRIRDAFYQKIAVQDRQKIHEEIALTIEKMNAESKGKVIFDLSHHFVESGNKEKMLEYILPAAAISKASFANEEAIKYFIMVIELLEDKSGKGDNEWIKATEDLVEVYVTFGRYEEAIDRAENALPYVDQYVIDKARLYRSLGFAYYKKGDWAKCEEYLAEGMSILGEKIPRTKKSILYNICKGLIVHVILELFSNPAKMKVKETIKEEDKEIIRLYFVLNWMYVLSNPIKFVCNIIRALNLSETRYKKSSELATFLGCYGVVCGLMGFFKKSFKYNSISYDMMIELSDEWGIAQSLQLIGYMHSWSGDYNKGIEILQDACNRSRNIGDMWEYGINVNALGCTYRYMAEYSKAVDSLNRYKEVSELTKNSYGIISAQVQSAYCYVETGDFTIAEELIRKGISAGEHNKEWPIFCYSLMYYGFLEIERENFDLAVIHFEKAKEIYEKNKYIKDYTIFIFHGLAESYLKANARIKNQDPQKTSQVLKKVRELCRKSLRLTKTFVNHRGGALRVTGEYYSYLNRNKKAEACFLKAITHTKGLGRKYELAKNYFEYGNFLNKLDRYGEALNNWCRAYEIFSQIGSKVNASKCAELIRPAITLNTLQTAVGIDQPNTRGRLKYERSLNTVLSTSMYISSILELEELLEKIMDNAIELVGAERGILLLYPEEGDKKLEVKSVRNVSREEISSKEFMTSMTIISRIEKGKTPLIITDALMDEKLKNQSSIVLNNIRSVLCTPIMTKGEMIGVLYMDNNLLSGLFSDEDMDVLKLISNQAGVSIENARLYSRLMHYLKEIETSRDEIEKWNQELELRVNERTEQLKEHATTVVELALAKERNRFARDVHDTLGHSLSLLTKLLEACKISIGLEMPHIENKIDDAINISREGLKEVRRSVSGLRPVKLEVNNLYNALAGLISEFELSGMNIDFSYEYDHEIAYYELSEAVFRICQESLTNSLRHGKAKNVRIAVKNIDNKLKIFIVDDGLGCKDIKKGFGLSNMEKRVTDLNGSIAFNSDGERGMYIMAEIPYIKNNISMER